MELMSINEAANKISNSIIKQIIVGFKNSSDDETSFSVPVFSAINQNHVNVNNKKKVVETYSTYNYGYEDAIDFVPLNELWEQTDLCLQILRELNANLKKDNKFIMIPIWDIKTKIIITKSNEWHNNYEILTKIDFVKPCKEFGILNDKLLELELKEIDPSKWKNQEVSGKRDFSNHISFFNHTSCDYFCTNPNMCNKVLAFLEGKKNVFYDYKTLEHLEDKMSKELYGRAWTGNIEYHLVFTDSEENATVIY